MKNSFYQKKFWILFIAMALILSGCSGLPMRLKSTADQSMLYLSAEISIVDESFKLMDPLIIDQRQISEDKWCLTYEVGHEFPYSSLWEKHEQNWVRVELRPYEENCRWAR